MVRNGKPDNVIIVVMWKKKAVYKCHFIAQQPFLMSYLPLKLTRLYIQSDYFIHWSYENFSEINNQRTNGPVNAHLRSASYTNKHI